jgi:pSer/pThr/pTyr-binding forkhead associated (FHA) protein
VIRQLSHIIFEPLVKSLRNPYAGMITVGRAPNNDICLPVRSVSKLHAYFQRDGACWRLRDSMSSFGTFLGGERLAGDRSAPVENGVEVAFGPDSSCTFVTAGGLHAFLRGLNPPAA